MDKSPLYIIRKGQIWIDHSGSFKPMSDGSLGRFEVVEVGDPQTIVRSIRTGKDTSVCTSGFNIRFQLKDPTHADLQPPPPPPIDF